MSKIAVIKTGGKQYVVKEGQSLKVEKLPQKAGQVFELEQVLLTADGENVNIGKPIVNAKVSAVSLEEGRAKKVRVVKYKAKTRYHKVQGHRQPYTKILIKNIA